MEETGQVLAASAGRATLRMTTQVACSSCSQQAACHGGEGAERQLEVNDPLGVAPGQEVAVHIPGRVQWLAIGAVYVWPLVTLLVGAWLGHGWIGGGVGEAAELWAAIGALAGVGAGFALLRWARPWYEPLLVDRPVVLRVIPSSNPQ